MMIGIIPMICWRAQSAEEVGDIADAVASLRYLMKSDPTDASAPFISETCSGLVVALFQPKPHCGRRRACEPIFAEAS